MITWLLSDSFMASMLIAARAYPGFCSMKRLRVFLLFMDGLMLQPWSKHIGTVMKIKGKNALFKLNSESTSYKRLAMLF